MPGGSADWKGQAPPIFFNEIYLGCLETASNSKLRGYRLSSRDGANDGYLQMGWDACFCWSLEIGWKDAGFPVMQGLPCKVVGRLAVPDRTSEPHLCFYVPSWYSGSYENPTAEMMDWEMVGGLYSPDGFGFFGWSCATRSGMIEIKYT